MVDNRYPKAKYHVDGSSCVVYSEDEEKAQDVRLWFDHPDKAHEACHQKHKPPEPPEPPKPPKSPKPAKERMAVFMEGVVHDDGK